MRIKKKSNERFPRFSLIDDDFFTDKTCFICRGKNLERLVCALNSSVSRYQLQRLVSMMDNGGYLMQKIYVEQIRLPSLSKIDSDQLYSLFTMLKTERVETSIDEIIFDAYGFTLEERDYILSR